MFQKIVSIFTIVCAIGTLGFVLFQRTRTDHRFPASIPKIKVFDFSQIEKGSPEVALRKHILNHSEATVQTDKTGIRVGGFLVRNSEGQTLEACAVYDSVAYTFEAEGMAVNGERPKLVLSGACHITDSASQLDTLWIPVAELMKRQPGNMDYTLNDVNQTSIHLEDMDMAWPRHWVLSNVKFHGRDIATAPLEMDRLEVYKYSRTPLMMYWNKR